jgi:hypothetical protein
MITYINSLNIIKNAMILKKIRIKIKSDFKTKKFIKNFKEFKLNFKHVSRKKLYKNKV